MKYVAFLIVMFLLSPEIGLAYSPGPMMNPWQAYPPSCLSNSMMDDDGGMMMNGSSGPTWTSRVELPTVNNPLNGPVGTEMVTFTMWRVPCSDGKSALMGRIAREHSGLPEPIFGSMFISDGMQHSHQLVRIARDANTMWSDMTGAPFMNGFDFVVENSADYQIDFSRSLELSIEGMSNVSMMIPPYDSHDYADSDMPLMMSGYMSGNWFDPEHSGEGAQVEVGETSSNARYMVFAWYTFDSNGMPFWLFGAGPFNAGDRSANIMMAYVTGGGFAGNFGPNAMSSPWGTVTVQYPDCRTMHFDFQANANLPAYVPHGSGSRTWTRLTSINGFGCD